MRRDEVLAILAEHRDEIKSQGVKSLSLFGAIARDEDDPDEEIEILLEIGQRPFGLFAFVGLKDYLEELLGRPVHLVTSDGIKDGERRYQVLREASRAAETCVANGGRHLGRDDVLAILAAHRDEIRAHGVTSLALFGSVARNEAGPDSDIDLLIEVERPFGLFALARLQMYLEELFGRRIDLVHRDSIKPRLRDRILKEAVDAA